MMEISSFIEARVLGHAGIAQGLDHFVNRSLANRHLAHNEDR